MTSDVSNLQPPGIERLPVESKIELLEHIIDTPGTLIPLLQSSRLYAETFKNHYLKLYLPQYRLDLDACRRESLFAASFAYKLTLRDNDPAAIRSICEQYVRFDDTAPGSAYHDTDGQRIEVSRETLVQNHAAIHRLYTLIVKEKLHSRFGYSVREEATALEMSRIIKALYRYWVFLIVYGMGSYILERRFFSIRQQCEQLWMVNSVLGTWSFWDFMAVRTVNDFLWEKLLPVAHHNRKEHCFLENTNIDNLKSLCEYAPRQFGMVVTAHFPNKMALWLTSHPASRDLKDQLEDLYTDCWKPQCNKSLARYFVDYLNGDVWTPGGSSFEEHFPDTPPLRVCKSGHTPFLSEEAAGLGSWVRPFHWREKEVVDFSACLWDDWRLEELGYVMPAFRASDVEADVEVNEAEIPLAEYHEPIVEFTRGHWPRTYTSGKQYQPKRKNRRHIQRHYYRVD
ncbi:hypothetical protein TWF696_004876 [Orbilia brochopaga]|uniref:Uncharacterized protein n=1 Tax=Orbilia brochopaga TaxID=3140254 RepID=A0AAV9UZY1_9PEZI